MSQNPNHDLYNKSLPQLQQLLAEVLTSEDEDGKCQAQAILEALVQKAKNGDVRAADLILEMGYGRDKNKDDEITIHVEAKD
jgi:hypothetical protein